MKTDWKGSHSRWKNKIYEVTGTKIVGAGRELKGQLLQHPNFTDGETVSE